ncbi:Response regulator of zinc sigma-54-dependent two-component system [Labilithrix luteola]|uniref:Response regulator of zinc sigma-54-dependent two-component system n=1 Tax=Labilithrix luteola TaxID=1391654 RepID=A0A0K1QDE7_9BACT|nr:sigma 54-interacting transcriptional regulator [Labilithrix luteola]AKV03779.1 Response regulator of zinc sigma-54-dependent two-component system [Labilithrix luteola]
MSEETRIQPQELPPTQRSQPRLDWTDRAGHHFRVLEGRVLVGSSESSGIVIQDDTVSRLHAELEVRSDGLWIRDLGSRNGTFVEGMRVSGALVPEHGRIRLGMTDLLVDYGANQPREVELWPSTTFNKLVGASLVMRELFASIHRLRSSDAPVLIQGETGTGKELVARAIHDTSARSGKPFVVVDCAALPDSLLDSELFGHARGSFTGALGDRAGAIEAAEGGTVFLDEIGELPLTMQPKLLRALEQKTIRRLGETQHRKVDVRFLSATHRDLLRMVNAGAFREDLYFRLCVIPIDVPPLREREEDIEPLINNFLAQAADTRRFSPQILRTLMNFPWRGNVRELRNFVERARALGPDEALAIMGGGSITRGTSRSRSILPSLVEEGSIPPPPLAPHDLLSSPVPSESARPAPVSDTREVFRRSYRDFREAWIEQGEREYVRELLVRHNRNVAAAAKDAEVDRTHIYRLIRKHTL